MKYNRKVSWTKYKDLPSMLDKHLGRLTMQIIYRDGIHSWFCLTLFGESQAEFAVYCIHNEFMIPLKTHGYAPHCIQSWYSSRLPESIIGNIVYNKVKAQRDVISKQAWK